MQPRHTKSALLCSLALVSLAASLGLGFCALRLCAREKVLAQDCQRQATELSGLKELLQHEHRSSLEATARLKERDGAATGPASSPWAALSESERQLVEGAYFEQYVAKTDPRLAAAGQAHHRRAILRNYERILAKLGLDSATELKLKALLFEQAATQEDLRTAAHENGIAFNTEPVLRFLNTENTGFDADIAKLIGNDKASVLKEYRTCGLNMDSTIDLTNRLLGPQGQRPISEAQRDALQAELPALYKACSVVDPSWPSADLHSQRIEVLLTRIAASANTHLSPAQANQLMAICSDNLHLGAAMYAKMRENQPAR